MPTFPLSFLKQWFLENRRELPWREERTPYRVWVAEVMLQQTRSVAVIPYFEKWFEQFPDIETLAKAEQETVLKAWEGLGYYQRARFLHAAAKMVVESFGGALPSDADKLASLPGFGPYTVGAVLSFAFHKKAAAVDGNVMRVLARYFGMRETISSALYKKIHLLLEELLPDSEPWIVIEALIELGAEVCLPSPKCGKCPLQTSCDAHLQKDAALFPKAKPKVIIELFREVLVIVKEEQILVCKNPKGKVMADLYEFPYLSCDRQPLSSGPVFERFGVKLHFEADLALVSHTFTRFKAHLFAKICKTSEEIVLPGAKWIGIQEAQKFPFSSGHKKILQQVLKYHENLTYRKL